MGIRKLKGDGLALRWSLGQASHAAETIGRDTFGLIYLGLERGSRGPQIVSPGVASTAALAGASLAASAAVSATGDIYRTTLLNANLRRAASSGRVSGDAMTKMAESLTAGVDLLQRTGRLSGEAKKTLQQLNKINWNNSKSIVAGRRKIMSHVSDVLTDKIDEKALIQLIKGKGNKDLSICPPGMLGEGVLLGRIEQINRLYGRVNMISGTDTQFRKRIDAVRGSIPQTIQTAKQLEVYCRQHGIAVPMKLHIELEQRDAAKQVREAMHAYPLCAPHDEAAKRVLCVR